jgi:hypothetical protein
MPFSADPTFRWRFALRLSYAEQKMFGKDDLVDNLSRDLDRARERRDALASEVTTLTAQIAEIEARLSEEKTRRERDRVLGEIEAIKKRIKQATGAFAPVIGKLCEAIEMAATVVPEARELNSFLLSVATEVDSVVDPLLREMDQRADAVRAGHVTLDLPCSANGAPIEPSKDNSDRLLRFPVWLSRNKEVEKKKQRRTRAAQQRDLSARCATKENLRPIEPARQPNLGRQ